MVTGYNVKVSLKKGEPLGMTKRSMERAVSLSMMELKGNLQRNSPVDEGKIQGSWHIQLSPGKLQRKLQSSAKYAQDVNDGTGLYGPKGQLIRPVTKPRLAFMYHGRYTYRRLQMV